MITPRFELAQDDDSVTIKVRAPYCDLNELDVDINETSFVFYCSPYFLRLSLPGRIVETDRSSCKFDADAQVFVFRIDKATTGERFADLDMIAKLLSPVASETGRAAPSIEVISSSDSVEDRTPEDARRREADANGERPAHDEDLDSDDVDRWCVEQAVGESNVEGLVFDLDRLKIRSSGSGYGFAGKRTGYLDGITFELSGVLDDVTIPNVNPDDRRALMDRYLKRTFDPKHYVCDLYDGRIDALIDFRSPLSDVEPESVEFGAEESDTLKDFPNREYLFEGCELEPVYLGLVDILFGYCYDMRCWSFEPTVESAWAYNRLSPVLSAFVTHENLRGCIVDCFKRALTLPLFRNLELCNAALGDLKTLLGLGKKTVVRSLLEIYRSFNSAANCRPRYILNELYIKDYLIFVQKSDYRRLNDIRDEIDSIVSGDRIRRDEFDFGLNELEAEAFKDILDGGSSTDTDGSSTDTDSSSTETDDSSD